MQIRKFDELISYFNRNVAEMSIDTKYKMELLGMVTALGLAHKKELDAHSEQRWIPVTKRLPEPRIDVWCNSDLGQMVGYYDETIETWFGRDYLELLVNAWMPLPESYREGEENV